MRPAQARGRHAVDGVHPGFVRLVRLLAVLYERLDLPRRQLARERDLRRAQLPDAGVQFLLSPGGLLGQALLGQIVLNLPE